MVVRARRPLPARARRPRPIRGAIGDGDRCRLPWHEPRNAARASSRQRRPEPRTAALPSLSRRKNRPSRAPPDQCSPPAFPVQARPRGAFHRSPRTRADLEEARRRGVRDGGCARRRRPGPAASDGRSVSNLAESGFAIRDNRFEAARSANGGDGARPPMNPNVTASDSPAAVSDRRTSWSRGDAGIRRGRGGCDRGKRRLEPVEAVVASDFLDEIGLARAGRRGRSGPSRPSRRCPARRSSPSPCRIRSTSSSGTIAPSKRASRRRRRWTVLRLARLRVRVDQRLNRRARADLLDERERALERGDRRVDVGAALEPRRGLRLEPQPLAGSPHRRRLEVRALEWRSVVVSARHFRRRAAHHAGDGLRAVAIGDDEHVGVELCARRRRAS